MPVILDPDAAAVFKAFQETGRPPFETVSPSEARELYLQGRIVTNPEPPELKSVQPLAIPAPHGSIPSRVYTPLKLRDANRLADVQDRGLNIQSQHIKDLKATNQAMASELHQLRQQLHIVRGVLDVERAMYREKHPEDFE